MSDYVKVEGLADAKRAIEELTRDLRLKVVRGALRDAARPIVQQARANAPVRTGLIKKRIAVAASRIKRGQGGEIGVYIKPRISNAARRDKSRALDPFYYRFQEAGYHATGGAKLKNNPNARFIPGKAFLGSAFQTKQRESLEIFQAAIRKRIEQANKRK